MRMNISFDEILFVAGVIMAAAAGIVMLVNMVAYFLRKRKLSAILDAEYGEKPGRDRR